MNDEIKERIIQFNKQFELKTEFIIDENILGYALNDTIYINSSIEQDYERTNKHELLHFFEESEEFENIKQKVLKDNEANLDKIRAEYELRYFGLYSEDEIKAGVIDNEIVIDLLIDNSVIKYNEGLIIGDTFLRNTVRDIEQKRYLILSLNNNTKNLKLSEWEKLFVMNYYNRIDRPLPQGKSKLNAIKRDIDANLQKLYEMKDLYFRINSDSPEVLREYENTIKSLMQKGENSDDIKRNKEIHLKCLADKFSKRLWEEYNHIVEFIKDLEYEPAFKYLILNETLTKIYKKDVNGKKTKTIGKKRDLKNSIEGHMVLNRTILDFIFNNFESYDKFADLYFKALEVFNETTAKKNRVLIEGVETFGKGYWLKFKGKSSNESEYQENAERLSSFAKKTPWCTKELALEQLAEGDFFIFVDIEEKPHIAIKTIKGEFDEVRGILEGQEIEKAYIDVVLSFLKNNNEIPNGIEWLKREKWNNRLIRYNEKINERNLTKEDIPGLINDLFYEKAYKNYKGQENSNKVELKKNLYKIKGLISEYYGYDENEICTYEDLEKKIKEIRDREELKQNAKKQCITQLENFKLDLRRIEGSYDKIENEVKKND